MERLGAPPPAAGPPRVEMREQPSSIGELVRGSTGLVGDVQRSALRSAADFPGRGMSQALSGITGTKPDWRENVSDVVEGGAAAASPVMAATPVAAIPRIAAWMGAGALMGEGTRRTAEVLGAEPETARLAGNVAGLATLPGIAKPLLRGRRPPAGMPAPLEAQPGEAPWLAPGERPKLADVLAMREKETALARERIRAGAPPPPGAERQPEIGPKSAQESAAVFAESPTHPRARAAESAGVFEEDAAFRQRVDELIQKGVDADVAREQARVPPRPQPPVREPLPPPDAPAPPPGYESLIRQRQQLGPAAETLPPRLLGAEPNDVRIANELGEQALLLPRGSARPAPPPVPEPIAVAKKRISKKLKSERGSFSDRPVDPDEPSLLDDLVLVGKHYAGEAGATFDTWSAKMVADLGEHVRPQLDTVWRKVNAGSAAALPTAQQLRLQAARPDARPPLPPPPPPGEPDIINVKHFNVEPEAKEHLRVTAESVRPELEKMLGKKLSHDEVINAARHSDILQRATSRESTLKREAALLALRQQIAKQAEGGSLSREFIDNLRVLKGEQASIARQLGSLAIEADPVLKSAKSQIVQKLIGLGKTTDEILADAKNVNWDNPLEATAFYRKHNPAQLNEILNEYAYINLLSSPRTHVVNAFSNLTQAGFTAPMTHLYSGGLDFISSALTGARRTKYAREVQPYFRGMLSATGDAAAEALAVIKGKRFVERPDVEHLPTNVPGLRQLQVIPRALEASDMFFRTLIKSGEREALAYRAMRNGEPVNAAALDKQAGDKAAYYVFRQKLDPSNATGQGHLLAAVDKATNAMYVLRKVPGMKWFLRFIQTPMNILKQGIEYSPAGFATMAGAADPQEQAAKALIGSTVFAAAAWVAAKGDSTWAPPQGETARKEFYASGRQPYSMKIGNTWVGYSKLGPIAYPVAMTAAIKYHDEQSPAALSTDKEEALAKALGGIAGFFSDQSYVEGVSSLIDMARGRGSARAIANVPSQYIPLSSLQRWVAQIVDPVYRETGRGANWRAIVQNLQRGIPFASRSLPAQTDLVGRPSHRPMPGANAVSPVTLSPAQPQSEPYYQQRLRERQWKRKYSPARRP